MSPPLAVHVRLSCLFTDDDLSEELDPWLYSAEKDAVTAGATKFAPAETFIRSIFSWTVDAAMAEVSFVL